VIKQAYPKNPPLRKIKTLQLTKVTVTSQTSEVFETSEVFLIIEESHFQVLANLAKVFVRPLFSLKANLRKVGT
jgi:hypothetical protein